ncbi:hypothetical protein NX059_002743 [Plenodomus lindquistii]|nr:hypothetical protein NX059_002743 [Plenodomus lindquistii]
MNARNFIHIAGSEPAFEPMRTGMTKCTQLIAELISRAATKFSETHEVLDVEASLPKETQIQLDKIFGEYARIGFISDHELNDILDEYEALRERPSQGHSTRRLTSNPPVGQQPTPPHISVVSRHEPAELDHSAVPEAHPFSKLNGNLQDIIRDLHEKKRMERARTKQVRYAAQRDEVVRDSSAVMGSRALTSTAIREEEANDLAVDGIVDPVPQERLERVCGIKFRTPQPT